jgi:threonylcarbamoyladenosine tRNA methylthiotransferase MtaB
VKYAVLTFGCRVNQADSLGFEEELRAAGAEAVSPDHADLVVVNTCSVTASADQGARQTIRRVARANPHAHIVVTGCYATRRPDEVRDLPNVLRVVPNDDKPRLLQIVRRVRLPLAEADLSTAERFGDGEGSCGSAIAPGVAGRTAFTLRVQTGCAEPCAYCIIPSTRGAPRSVAPGAVLAEVDRVAASGFKEIALTGVHLGSYGRDLTPGFTLIDLLRTLAARSRARESTLEREVRERAGGGAPASGVDNVLFRISSLEPMDCTGEVVELVAASRRFAPHFHLPLQHASDRILARMRRPYTIGDYSALVDAIRARMPAASIGSDVIVGFPGESDGDFEQLASYLERSPLTHLHVFPYSDRPDTEAAAMDPKVSGAVIRKRGSRLREIGHRLTTRFRESQVGTVHRGLTLEDGSLVVTDNYLKVRIPPGRSRNEWVSVRITRANEPMTGEVC